LPLVLGCWQVVTSWADGPLSLGEPAAAPGPHCGSVHEHRAPRARLAPHAGATRGAGAGDQCGEFQPHGGIEQRCRHPPLGRSTARQRRRCLGSVFGPWPGPLACGP